MTQNLPKSGVFALINKQDNKVYLAFSSYILGAVSKILYGIYNKDKKYRKLRDDLDKLEFVVLFETVNPDIMIQQYNYYCDYYKIINYSFYRDYKARRYKVRTELNDSKVFVYLVTNSNKKKLVGVFTKIHEANEFIKVNYSVDYIKPVIADNELTKRYIEML